MRTVRDRIVDVRRSLHLLVRMHFLRTLFPGNEKRLPELQWRIGAPTGAAGRGIADRSARIRRASDPADLCMALALTYPPLIPILGFASSRICFLRQPLHVGKEGGRLADEKAHVSQEP